MPVEGLAERRGGLRVDGKVKKSASSKIEGSGDSLCKGKSTRS